MADYRLEPSTDPEKPDIIVGDDTLSHSQFTALALAIQNAAEAGIVVPGNSPDDVLAKIKKGEIQ